MSSGNATQTSMGEMLRLILDNRLLEVHTALPGEITAYYSSTRTCDVQPLVKQTIRDLENNEEIETLPIIQNVPVQYLGGSGFFIAAPLAVGDTGLITFAENHIGNWQETGKLDEPEDTERHGLLEV